MSNNETVKGEVVEALKGAQFYVEIPNVSSNPICYLSGKMYKNRINVLVGDKVEVVLAPDLKRGRIIKRL